MAHQVARGQAGATPTIQATGEAAEMNTVRMMMNWNYDILMKMIMERIVFNIIDSNMG